MLTRRHFVVVLVNFHAHALHGGQHFAAHIMCIVGRVHREIAAFNARAVASVAHFIFSVSVPRPVDCVNLVRHFVDADRIAHVVKDEKFSFWAEKCSVTDAGRRQICFSFFGCAARVARIRFASVRLDHVAMNADGLFSIERINIS